MWRPDLGPRVLVVADDGALVALLEYHLNKEGFVVDVAADASRAVEAARLAPPSLLVVDTDLQDFGMVAVCRAILNRLELRGASVLVLVGQREDRTSLARLGFAADASLAKPFHLTELTAAVQAALCRRPVIDSPYPADGRAAAS